MRAFLNRIGAWCQHAWHNPAVRRTVKRLALLALVIVASPWLVALWDILLVGERVQQGLLLITAATCWTAWLIARDAWRAHQEKRKEREHHGQTTTKTIPAGAGTRRKTKAARRQRRRTMAS